MNRALITCAMCGARYSPAENQACSACPLSQDCQLTCCPSCGFENVDVSQSSLARLAARLLGRWLPQEDLEESNTRKNVQKDGVG